MGKGAYEGNAAAPRLPAIPPSINCPLAVAGLPMAAGTFARLVAISVCVIAMYLAKTSIFTVSPGITLRDFGETIPFHQCRCAPCKSVACWAPHRLPRRGCQRGLKAAGQDRHVA